MLALVFSLLELLSGKPRPKLDPTEVFAVEINELIFSQLNGNDLKQCTLVNRNWNEQIGSSLRCMSKLMLLISQGKFHAKDFSSTKRRHQNVHIIKGINDLGFIIGMMNSINNRGWKSVKISDCTFPSSTSVKYLFKIFETAVEDLTLRNVRISYPLTLFKAFSFERLESLEIQSCDEAFTVELFVNCSSLSQFRYTSCKRVRSVNQSEGIIELLKRQTGLRILHLRMREVRFLELDLFPFRLEEVSLCNYLGNPTYEFAINYFEVVLINQQTILSKLVLECSIYFNVTQLKFILYVRSLKELQLTWLPAIPHEQLLPLNKSLEKFTLQRYSNLMQWDAAPTDDETIKAFLKCTPNLKAITLEAVDKKMARFLAHNLRNLEKVSDRTHELDQR